MSEQKKDDEVTLKELILILIDWFKYVKVRWKFIFVISFVGAALGFTIAYFKKPVYTAELTLALEDKGSGGGSYAGLASQFGLDIGGSGGGAFNGDNSIELLKSRFLIETTLLTPVMIDNKSELLVNRYIDFNEFRKGWEKDPELKDITFKENEPREQFGIKKDSILKVIYKRIKKNDLVVEKIDKKLSIIKVLCSSGDELFAKLFTEVIVQTATEFYIDTKTKKSKTNLDILSHRLDSVKRELDIEIYGAAINKDRNTNIVRAEGSVQSAKKQLNIQVLTTMYGELIKNTEMAKFTLMREEPLIQIIDRPILPLDKKKMGKLLGLIGGGFVGFILSIIGLWGIRMKSIIMDTPPG